MNETEIHTDPGAPIYLLNLHQKMSALLRPIGKTLNSLAHSHCGWLGFMIAHKGWIQPLCHQSTTQFMTGNRLRGIDTVTCVAFGTEAIDADCIFSAFMA